MGETPLERFKRMQRNKERGLPEDTPADADVSIPSGPKKPGEPCSHPKERRAREPLSGGGSIVVCLDCGSTVSDSDLEE